MHFSGSHHRKGGSGAERLRVIAVCLGLAAFLAGGCAGTPAPPANRYSDADRDPPPLPITSDGNLRSPVRPVGWTSESVQPFKPDGVLARGSARQGVFSLASASGFNRSPEAPRADAESLRLPSLQLATDGPLARFALPSNEGPWSPDQAALPWVEFRDDLATVHNIRNCYYRTIDDYTVRLYTKTFDLRKLTSVDLIVVPFNDNPSIAHVALSFGFQDNDFLVSSVEIRKRAGQTYSALNGFFNQYTIMYVLADERDMMWKETIGFQSEVYIYRTRATPRQAQEMFVDVLRRVNKLVREPEFYNTVTNNCTTNVRNHVNHLLPDRVPYDYRVLLPGYAPELAYDLGLIEKKDTFAQTKAAAKVNFNAYLYADAPEFSRRIRGK
jgi:hypothetical protein